MLNRLVQAEPATVLDPELMGQIAAIGIRKGREFAPDDRMKGILEEAIKVANATGRTLGFAPRDPTWFWYEGSHWRNPLFQGGYNFETPLPEITKDGAKPFPPTGYKQNDARTSFRNRTSKLSGRGTGRMFRPLTVQRGGGRRRSHRPTHGPLIRTCVLTGPRQPGATYTIRTRIDPGQYMKRFRLLKL